MILKKTSGYKRRKKKRISKNTAYRKGRYLEYRVKKYYEKQGWYVKRSYASRGAEDLNAQKKIYATWSDSFGTYNGTLTKVLHIQCKNLAVEQKLSKTERDNLLKLKAITGGRAMHVFNRNHKLVFEEIV